jgi:hypothetical protein
MICTQPTGQMLDQKLRKSQDAIAVMPYSLLLTPYSRLYTLCSRQKNFTSNKPTPWASRPTNTQKTGSQWDPRPQKPAFPALIPHHKGHTLNVP